MVEDDVGFGAIRIAWPELQGSGQLSLRLEDVPATDLDNLEALLNAPKPKRWLSWRGRRYRADGFEFSYEPDPEVPGLYAFSVECTVQRPYRALPPVPGTDVWPILHLKNIGGGVHDRILHVAVHWPYMAVFHTAGVALWNMDSGTKVVHAETVQNGLGLWQSQPKLGQLPPEYLIAFVDEQGRLVVLWFDGEGFFRSPSRTALSVGRHAHYDGRQLFVDTPNGLWAFDPNLQQLNSYDGNLRLNPSTSPLFLSEVPKPNAAYPLSSSTRMVWPVGKDKALCVEDGGIYLHKATHKDDAALEINERIRALVDGVTIENAGVFGSVGFPSGYWYAEPVVTETVTSSAGNYQVKRRNAALVSSFADRPVRWGNLVGIAFDGYAYFPYNERMVFRVEPLL